MTALLINNPYTSFNDLDGKPLQDGKIYIGTEGLNPVVNPINVYADKELQIPLQQPIRTLSGYPVSGNSPVRMFLNNIDYYSISIFDKNDRFIYSSLKVDANRPSTESTVNVKDYGAAGDNVTDDQIAIQNAVSYAYNNNKYLFWDYGTYVVNSSIDNFHDVVHVGNGILNRNGNLYYISPQSISNINTLFVSKTGNDTNDGMSTTGSLLTLQRAADLLESKGDFLQGSWVISVSDGTYDRIRFDDDGGAPTGGTDEEPGVISGTFSEGETISGSVSGFTGSATFDGVAFIKATITSGTPQINDVVTGATSGASAKVLALSPIPTVIIKEGLTQSAVGVRAANSTDITIKDILIQDFNGTKSSCGVNVSNKCNLKLENVHCTDCYIGASNQNYGIIDIKGGVFYDCGYLNSTDAGGYAIRGLFHCKYSVGAQNAGSMENAPIIQGCYIGVFGQELCTGHVDYTYIRNNSIGSRLSIGCRVNYDGSRFYDNLTNVWASDNSIISPSPNTIVGKGVNKHTSSNYLVGASCSISANSGLDGFSPALFPAERTVMARYDPVTVNTTSGTVIYELPTIAPYLAEIYSTAIPAQYFKIEVYGSLNGTNDIKRITHRFGGTNVGQVQFLGSETGKFYAAATLILASGGNSQYGQIQGSCHLSSTARHSSAASAINLNTTDATYRLEVQVDNASDSVTVDSYIIKACGF